MKQRDEASAACKWVTSWTASAQGPYPAGSPLAQPDLSFAFPAPDTGARDQSFRLILRPDLWGPQARLRLCNAFGLQPVAFDGVHVGLQLGGAALVAGSNQRVTFGGRESVTVPPGGSVWSDPVALPFACEPDAAALAGRKLAVSLHVVGESGPMTWHAKALQTSYLTPPNAGSQGGREDELAFPFTSTSWYFLDAVDMLMPRDTRLIVALGDSITDGSGSTLNGDDRWPDILSRRLHAAFGQRVGIVNAGIGSNQVAGPADYSPHSPFRGGPKAVARIERDVLSLSGVATVIWLEGINDFSGNGNASMEAVAAGFAEGVQRLRAGIPGVRVIGATLVPALGSTAAAHGHEEQDRKRRALNGFIRTAGLFDAVLDFEAATLDAATGGMKAEFVPDGTVGGPGDGLHPNRAGYLAMASAIDPGLLLPLR
ncbi:GDSL-type esterase/lipase family protein [uncultured Azohydromonas sp.]|jgi:Lysophospholipase L1 and related esterases|uniref:GDSL-type esterase/lipase family protein n=1 Tax=uncultured Azohydromonas sp. TaxID=487342 RepID=UPI00260EB953|nr:GDSL-type esterase/lipase family protein [uncultured Azohydromonas sp.]